MVVMIEGSILTAVGTEPITVRITPIIVQINRNIRLMTSLMIQSKNAQTSVGIGLVGVYVAMRLQIWVTALPATTTGLPKARAARVEAIETPVETIALTIPTIAAINAPTALVRVVRLGFVSNDVGI